MEYVSNYLSDKIAVLLESGQGDVVVLFLAFAFAMSLFLLVTYVVVPVAQTRRRIRQHLAEDGVYSRRSLLAAQEAEKIGAGLPVQRFFEKLEKGRPDSIQARLFRAGYYGASAVPIFYFIRVGSCVVVFFTTVAAGRIFLPNLSFLSLFLPALTYSLLFLILPNFILDRRGKRREEACRRGFPDFMDMMIVCADAGMSLEAAVQKVADELIYTHKALGLHLKIMTLEMRAGRALREALHSLAERLQIEEAKTLAVLFQQSEELGTSLTQTLRVYSAEMRDRRILRAEEKANALPVQMVLPLGLCIFPVILGMIMLPVLVRMKGIFF